MKKIGILFGILILCTTIFGETKKYETDVVIIGAGGAGMTAAIEAFDAGANVILFEKMAFPGGNTVRSKGGLNAAETSTQKEMKITDSVKDFYEDTMKGGKNINNPEVVKYFTENSAETVEWLKGIGMDLNDVGAGAGAKNPRMHRPTGGISIGGVLVKTLAGNVEKRNITVLYRTEAQSLVINDGKVEGVKAKDLVRNEDLEISSKAVVIATGGFAANEELYTKYRKDLKGFITTNHPGADGSGIVMAEKAGAELVDMEYIQTNPTVEQSKAEVISESVRGNGAIFVNKKGVRFISEMETRDKLSAVILEQPEEYVYIIFDQGLRERMKAVEEMDQIGILITGKDLKELAAKISVEPKVLEDSVAKWNGYVKNGKDEEFGRTTGMKFVLEKGPFYAIPVAPGVHHTMGGIKINSKTEVLGKDNKAIKGLYAAGEVTGGVHGANRLGGNAVADIIIFGRQAAKQSVEYIGKDKLMGNKNVGKSETAVKVNPELKAQYKDGTYKATAKGHNGDITVEVIVKDGFIDSIKAVESKETEMIFKGVENEMIPAMIYNQTSDVDMVTGATVSSRAVRSAVKKALKN
ncbi:flavocytochrome c [Fusobacterium ulcerans]|uniref:flavocytochrome c n=1 Tax=Fusobacterium ulcerans TaxID=861 RepID=UPI00241D15EA|nr:flavocytochrome c [Fusobacterium ulcerans]